MQHEFEHYGKYCTVTVEQATGKKTWRAGGNFGENRVDVNGNSENQALNRWLERARYEANA